MEHKQINLLQMKNTTTQKRVGKKRTKQLWKTIFTVLSTSKGKRAGTEILYSVSKLVSPAHGLEIHATPTIMTAITIPPRPPPPPPHTPQE